MSSGVRFQHQQANPRASTLFFFFFPELLLLTMKFFCLLQFIVPISPSRETEATKLKCFCSGSPAEMQQRP